MRQIDGLGHSTSEVALRGQTKAACSRGREDGGREDPQGAALRRLSQG